MGKNVARSSPQQKILLTRYSQKPLLHRFDGFDAGAPKIFLSTFVQNGIGNRSLCGHFIAPPCFSRNQAIGQASRLSPTLDCRFREVDEEH